MKLKSLLLIFCLGCSAVHAQSNIEAIDSVSIRLLDKMTTVIGELSSVSFNLVTEADELNTYNEYERLISNHKIHMVGPNKMSIRSRGNKGNKVILYNGEYLNYYSFDENNYVTLEAPDNIMTMVDSMNTTFGIDFPAADIFYPSLVDDILEHFEQIHFLGLKEIDGQECFHIQATNDKMNFQLWIENNPMFLPKKYLIIDKGNSFRQYEGTFSDWIINLELPNEIFEFVPPQKARLISIQAKN